jgi:hypothetical protein
VRRPVVGVTTSLQEMTSDGWTELTAGTPATYVAAVQRAVVPAATRGVQRRRPSIASRLHGSIEEGRSGPSGADVGRVGSDMATQVGPGQPPAGRGLHLVA